MAPAALREAALAHLARFATTAAGLQRVLDRRIERWALRVLRQGDDPEQTGARKQQARADARVVVAEMVRMGAVDDAAFAQHRAEALTRNGRSRRAVAAYLASRGIEAEQIDAALEQPPDDALDPQLAAALLQARRRRIGPFASGDVDAAGRQRSLAVLARAGFPRDVAVAALDTERDTAEALIARLRNFP